MSALSNAWGNVVNWLNDNTWPMLILIAIIVFGILGLIALGHIDHAIHVQTHNQYIYNKSVSRQNWLIIKNTTIPILPGNA